MESMTGDDRERRRIASSRFQNLSIRRKLLVVSMAVCTIGLTLACTAFVFIEIHSFKRTLVRDMSALAEVVGQNAAAALLFSDRADAEETLHSLEAKPSALAAWLFSSDGSVLAHYARDPAAEVAAPDPPEENLTRFTENRLFVQRLITFDDRRIGGICLVTSLETMRALLRRNSVTIAVVLVVSFVLTSLLSSRLRRAISDPVSDLARVAGRVSREKDYAIRAEKHGQDEIGALFDAFNEMLGEIQRRDRELVQAKGAAEAAAKEAEDLLSAMEQVNLELAREVRERKQVEAELKRHRTHLEQLVEERTAQLTRANVHLQEEVVERRQAEESARSALEEKVVLLGEIHHRVKNNLQIVASLLEMSRHRARTPEAAKQLEEAHAKIFTMALIHSQLYRNERFDEVDMERHVRELSGHLASLFCRDNAVVPQIRVSDLRLPVTQAIPCALVLNELISNAFKYAFDGRDSGNLVISIRREDRGEIHMEVIDDGSGIPENVDIDHADSLGLKLVRNLVRYQLKGTLRLDRLQGTRVHIVFRVPEEDLPDAKNSARG